MARAGRAAGSDVPARSGEAQRSGGAMVIKRGGRPPHPCSLTRRAGGRRGDSEAIHRLITDLCALQVCEGGRARAVRRRLCSTRDGAGARQANRSGRGRGGESGRTFDASILLAVLPRADVSRPNVRRRALEAALAHAASTSPTHPVDASTDDDMRADAGGLRDGVPIVVSFCAGGFSLSVVGNRTQHRSTGHSNTWLCHTWRSRSARARELRSPGTVSEMLPPHPTISRASLIAMPMITGERVPPKT
eukprot:353849-Chlamydomonas_euryale.AAC.4